MERRNCQLSIIDTKIVVKYILININVDTTAVVSNGQWSSIKKKIAAVYRSGLSKKTKLTACRSSYDVVNHVLHIIIYGSPISIIFF